MSASKRIIDADVCVVGAGIVGLAHALEARRRGLTVAVLDRDDHAAGASVRNFGHLFFTSVADGAPFERAMLARERWLELIDSARLHVAPAGTLIVGREADEVALLEAVAADPARHARMLTRAEVGALAPIPTGEVTAGFHGTLDVRVNPREAVAGLAALLADDPQAKICWRAQVHEVEPGAVHAADLTIRSPGIIVCPGPDYRSLPPALRPGLEQLTLCSLQMLRLAAPNGHRYPTALATGLSLVRYPAFASRPESGPLRARLQAERPELLQHGIHLLVTQLPDGDLIVGDTHAYGDTPAPFGDELLYSLLLDEARRLLGYEPEVRQRWHGIYPSATTETDAFIVTAPLPGVRVVQNVAGIGMTLSPGQAPAVLDALFAETAAIT
jgi:FAD dependent oxidoreductase TIGR03364